MHDDLDSYAFAPNHLHRPIGQKIERLQCYACREWFNPHAPSCYENYAWGKKPLCSEKCVVDQLWQYSKSPERKHHAYQTPYEEN